MVELFEYIKNNKEYWNRLKLCKPVIIKALPIAKALYLRYSLLILFNNAITLLVYVDNAFCRTRINKKSKRKQVQLHNIWYENNKIRIEQPMSY